MDDGSTDRTKVIIQSLSAIYLHTNRVGPATARNTGIARARGEILAFVDSDVVLEKGWLKAGLGAFSLPWVDVVQGPNVPDGDGDSFMLRYRQFRLHAHTGGTYNYLCLSERALPLINTAAVLMRKRLFSKISFHQDLLRCEDTDLSLQIFHEGAHYRTVKEMRSKVYDFRSPLEYLKRSWRTGRYLRLVSEAWGIKLGCVSPLPPSQDWRVVMFERLNRFSSKMGAVFTITKYSPMNPEIQPLKKNQFLIHESIGSISAFARIVLLGESTVIYSFNPRTKVILSAQASILFRDICQGRQGPLLAAERELLHELFEKKLLTVSG